MFQMNIMQLLHIANNTISKGFLSTVFELLSTDLCIIYYRYSVVQNMLLFIIYKSI